MPVALRARCGVTCSPPGFSSYIKVGSDEKGLICKKSQWGRCSQSWEGPVCTEGLAQGKMFLG